MNWKPGDIALCIQSGKRTTSGHTYVVNTAHPKGSPFPSYPEAQCLNDQMTLLELPPNYTVGCARFIKIDPENIEYETGFHTTSHDA